MLVSMEINIFCIIIFAILFFDLKRKDTTTNQKLFYWYNIDLTIFCLSDILSYALMENGYTSTTTLVFLYIINFMYFSTSAMAAYLWFLYVLEKLEINKEGRHLTRYFCFISICLFIVVVALSPALKFIYYFEKSGEHFVYQRGIGIWVHWVICWGFSLIPTTIAIIQKIKGAESKQRRQNILLFIVPLLPVAASVVQLFTGKSLVQIGMAIAIILIHIKLQDSHVFTDTLTGLYNRTYFHKYLDEKSKALKSNVPVFLMIIDVDDLGMVNDMFGYKIGDSIVYAVASIIKKIVSNYPKTMLARYEGDEFVIFGYDCTLQLIQEIKKNIKDAVEEWNRIETQTVDVTFGFIKGTKGYFNSFELLIDFAYSELQKEKDKKKNKTRQQA